MGKASIVYVMGLTLILGVTLNNVTQNSVSSVDAFTAYYGTTQVHDIALAGANIGTNALLNSGSPPTDFSFSFFGGRDSVIFVPDVPQPLWVTLRSVAWTSTAGRDGLVFRDTVEGVFKHVQFAKFSWFTESETNGYVDRNGNPGPHNGSADWKITGDSVFGPAHTNNRFNLDGTPYFHDKVTAGLAPNLGGSANPVYNGGYQWGINKRRPNTTFLESRMTTGAGWYYDGGGSNDVELTFMNTNVRLRIPPQTGAMRDTTMPITSLAPNGVMVVKSGDVRVKGTYSGAITIAAFKGSSGAAVNKGNVWIDGDLVAATNPVTNPNSPDMLGIVAGRMAYISRDNTRTPGSVLNLQAAVYCQDGELAAEEYWNIPVSGRVNLYGGVTQKSAGSLGVFNPGPPISFISGFSYSIRNDPRFEHQQPPMFPYSDSYELVSWWEN
ncbi:MAG: hypothetical protein AB1428_03090 [Bacteroidota bacterium]